MTVDQLIAALREVKKANQHVGKATVYAGDTNFITVGRVAVNGNGRDLTVDLLPAD